MEFSSRIITYGDLRKGLEFDKDKYGIASYEYESRRKTFLSNPNLGNDDDTFMYLIEADGIPVGRTMLFDTRLKVGNEIVPLYSGSGLEVEKSFRRYGIGAEIFIYGRTIKKRKLNLSAGISDMALPLYKVMKYTIFEFPKLLQLRDAQPLLGKYGINGLLQRVLGCIINALLCIVYSMTNNRSRKLKKQYEVEKVDIVPLWVDEIILNDGHKYAEVHDHRWLQWCLDNNFKGHKRNIQSFYILKQKGEPIGYVMTKERFREDVQGLKDVMIGSIVEWGVKNGSQLCESDLYRLIIDSFSNDIDIIETATNDKNTIKKLKLMGFIHYGDAHIAFKDRTKMLNDANDASLWRLRYGYADVIMN